MALTQQQMRRVDAFQHRGLRQILKIQHTFVNRANTNERIFEIANSYRFPHGGRLRSFSEYYRERRLKLFGHVLRSLPEDPMRRVTFIPETGAPLFRAKNRVGRPRQNWTLECYTQAWQEVCGGAGSYSLGRADIEARVMEAALARKF